MTTKCSQTRIRLAASRRGRRLLLAAMACLVLVLDATGLFSAAHSQAAEEPKQLPTKGNMLIRVVDPNGRPIAGARLFANVCSFNRDFDGTTRPSIENSHYLTGDDGSVQIKLPPLVEDLRLWARMDGYAPMFALWWPKQQAELKKIPDEFTYHMRKGTSLGGFVTSDDVVPIAGVKVEVQYESKGLRAKPNEAVFDTWLAAGDGAVYTDAQGHWRLDNVPPGDDVVIHVKLNHPDYIGDKDWGQLQQEQGVTLKSLRDETAVIVMHQGSVLTGTVTDPQGRPIEDAVVIWGDRPYWEEGSQEVRTDEKGGYHFPPLPPGKTHVTVVAEGWMPERTEIAIASHPHTQPLDFRLRRGKKLRIRFVDQSKAAVSRVAVQITTWQGAESLYNHKHSKVLDTKIPHKSDENGVYEWNWAPDSPVEFRFSSEGFAGAKAALTADDTEQVFTLLPVAGPK